MRFQGCLYVILLVTHSYGLTKPGLSRLGLSRQEWSRQADMTQMCITAKCMDATDRLACVRTRCGEVIDFNSGRRDVGDDFNQNGGKPEEERSQIEEDNRQNDVEIHPDVAKWFARWHKERMNEGDDEIQQLLQQQRFVYKPYKPFRGVQLKNIHSKKGYNDLYRVCMERHCAGAESSLNVLQCAIKNACA